jgi:hypothetical protein
MLVGERKDVTRCALDNLATLARKRPFEQDPATGPTPIVSQLRLLLGRPVGSYQRMNLSHALEGAIRSTTAPRATLLAGFGHTNEAIGVGPDGDQHVDSHSSKVAAQAASETSGRKQPPAKSGDSLAAGSLWAIQLTDKPACWARPCSKRPDLADGWTLHGPENHARAEYSGGPRDAKGGGAVKTQGRSRLGRPRRVGASARVSTAHIERTDVRIAPPSANLQRTRQMRRAPACSRWSPPQSR